MQHDETSPGQATFQSRTFTSGEPALSALLQLTAEQRAHWEHLLTVIEQASTNNQLDISAATAGGYALGLRDARAISPEQCDELGHKLKSRRVEAATRLSVAGTER